MELFMKKNILNSVYILCTILCCITIISGCKFFNTIGACKHTYTTFGICNLCSEDVSITLSKNDDNIYTTSSHAVSSNHDYYYKLTGNNENGIDLSIITSDSITAFNYVKIYLSQDEDDYVNFQTISDTSGTIYRYVGTLTKNNIYYIKISYSRANYEANTLLGNVSLQVTHIQ